MPRKLLISHASGPALEWARRPWPTFGSYARRHGYEQKLSLTRTTHRPASWEKVLLIADALEHFDVVVWLDADAIIVDGTDDIADGLDEGRDLFVRTTVAELGEVPNCGVLVWQRTRWARDFLQRVWRQQQFIESRWWEQAAILHLLGYRWDHDAEGLPFNCHLHAATGDLAHVGSLPDRFNSMPFAVVADPAIVHLAGTPPEQRPVLLDAAAAQAR